MPGSEVERWSRWINGAVHDGVIRMHFHRQIWRGVQEVISGNDELPPSAFWSYHWEIYIDAQTVAVRRQADLGPGAATLGRLILEIRNKPQALTSDWWLEQWRPEDDADLEFARRRWDSAFGGDTGHHLDPAIPVADLGRLSDAAQSVRAYVNRSVAHAEDSERTRTRPPADLTFGELDGAIDVIGELFRKYAHLIACVEVDLHTYMFPDWLAPFRQAWIRAD